MSPRLRHLALAAVLGAAAACSSKRGGRVPPPAPIVVVFHNQASDQAAVYARRNGGGTVRIGSVGAGRTDTLRLPVTFSVDGNVAFVARLLARRGFVTSGEIMMRPGQRVAVTLPPAANILSILPVPEAEP